MIDRNAIAPVQPLPKQWTAFATKRIATDYGPMIKASKPVTLSPIAPDHLEQFRLDTAHGRDCIAAQIEKDIDEWCQIQYDDGPRSHLGASIIGHDCDRYIWFSFRWMYREIFSGRMQRLFQRGHLEEHRIFEWLVGIGFKVVESTESAQFRITFAEGHGGGSMDGVSALPSRYGPVAGLMILLEMKTQKDNKFAILQGSGVQKEKPRHYSQASVYGRNKGLHYCLYIAVNKENDDLNIEVIELDWDLADAEMRKAEFIINSRTPPKRISENPSFWQCKWCPAVGVCHLNAPILKNCRSCYYAEAMPNTEWKCNKWNAIIPPEAIAQGCDAWISLATK